MNLKRVLAIAKKHLLLKLRFRWAYLFFSTVPPLKLAILFFFIYYGFYYSGAADIGGVTKENFVVFLALGAIMSNLFVKGFNIIKDEFMQGKWWQTVQGLLISPAKKHEIIVGFGIGGLIDLFPMILIAMMCAYLVLPIGILNLLYIIVLMLLMYAMVLGFGFIYAAFMLSNENYNIIFNIVISAAIFLSCFYYPMKSLPKFLHSIINLNPVYHANYAIKSVWMNGTLDAGILFYLLALAVLSLALGAYVFQDIWQKGGIQGY